MLFSAQTKAIGSNMNFKSISSIGDLKGLNIFLFFLLVINDLMIDIYIVLTLNIRYKNSQRCLV